MAHFLDIAAAAVATMALGGPFVFSASAQGNPAFRLVNETGATISEVFVSSNRSGVWDWDRLGDDVLPSGWSIRVTPDTCVNDIRVVYSNGSDDVRWSVDTCRVNQVVFGRYRVVSYR